MSIVTDTLNRLQDDRANLTRQPESASSSPEELSESSPPKTNHFGPQASSAMLGKGIRTAAILAVLGGVGLGAYFWGLTLIPEVAQVSSPPEAVVESTSRDSVVGKSQQFAESPRSAVSDQMVQESAEQDLLPSGESGVDRVELASAVPAP